MQRYKRCANIPMNTSATMNVLMVQRRRCYAGIPRNKSVTMNVLTTQRRRCYINVPMDVSATMNTLTSQLGTSYSFDSPGLARNEPTPGQRSQGDSTL